MSLRRSIGKPLRRFSSSTPRVATHLYWSYFLTDCLSSGGSCLWCIHCSVSVLWILHSSNRMVVDWRYVCKWKKYQTFASTGDSLFNWYNFMPSGSSWNQFSHYWSLSCVWIMDLSREEKWDLNQKNLCSLFSFILSLANINPQIHVPNTTLKFLEGG